MLPTNALPCCLEMQRCVCNNGVKPTTHGEHLAVTSGAPGFLLCSHALLGADGWPGHAAACTAGRQVPGHDALCIYWDCDAWALPSGHCCGSLLHACMYAE